MKKIVLIGMKACGKTTVGRLLAEKLKIKFIDLDLEIEKNHQATRGEQLTFREIFKKYGKKYFHMLENYTLKKIVSQYARKNFVLACGGRTPLLPKRGKILKTLGKIFYLAADKETLYQRIIKNRMPAFFSYPDNPRKSFEEIIRQRETIYEKMADINLDCGIKQPEEVVELIIKRLNLLL